MNYCYNKFSTKTLPMLLLLLNSLAIALQFQAEAEASPVSGCPKNCGDVDTVYPFGIGADCAMEGFKLDCNNTDGHNNVTIFRNTSVLNITLLDGLIRVESPISSMCYNRSSRKIDDHTLVQDVVDFTPFTFSEKLNKFIVVGINTLAYMVGYTNVIGCLSRSWPHINRTAHDGLCNGVGCCQAALTGNMSYNKITFDIRYNTTQFYNDRSATDHAEYCGYAMVMEAEAFRFRTAYLNTTAFRDDHDGNVPVILNWAVGNETCDVAKREASYACRRNNSRCVDSTSGPGYLCNCTQGYRGNPYLPDGCQDIDECVVNIPRPCPEHCTNTPGSFSCPNEKPSQGRVTLVVGLSVGVVIVVVVLTCTYLIRERKKLANIKQKYFQQHGGMLLLEQISLEHGTAFTVFTEAELMEVTNKFDDKWRRLQGNSQRRPSDRDQTVHVDDRHAAEEGVWQGDADPFPDQPQEHRQAHRLLPRSGSPDASVRIHPQWHTVSLHPCDNGYRHIPFSTRLRIAHESAQALDYLHSWASPPILHGDVKSSNILLDENYAAKVSDFGASILAPTDEAQFVTLVQGTCGYLDPEYMQTCQLSDKSDVYSFGVVLLEMIKKAFNLEGPENERSLSLSFLCAVKEGCLMDVIDDHIKSDEDAWLTEDVAELAGQCLEMTGERRPAMRDVAEKLDRLRKVMQHPWPQHIPEEMESLLEESSMAGLDMVGTGNFNVEKRAVRGLLESGR